MAAAEAVWGNAKEAAAAAVQEWQRADLDEEIDRHIKNLSGVGGQGVFGCLP